MRGLLLVLTVWLGGCQIIINHNTFEPAADATGDDAFPDAPSIPAAAVRSPSPDGTVVVAARIDRDGTTVDDGGWLTGSSRLLDGTNKVQHDFLTFTAFDGLPNCVCSSISGNNHGCFISNVTPSSATASVFDIDGAFSKEVFVLCVGPRGAIARPGLVTSPNPETMLLASARIDRATGSQPLEDGNWITNGTGLGGGIVDLAVTGFASNAACICTQTVDGESGSFCKIEIPPTAATGTMELASGVASGGAGSPIAFDLACLGKTANVGQVVVSPEAGGAVLASATIDGATNTVRRQDGNWLVSIAGGNTNSVTFAPATFGDLPRCLCSAVDFDNRACDVRSAPNASGNLQIEATDQNGASIDGDFSLICIGHAP